MTNIVSNSSNSSAASPRPVTPENNKNLLSLLNMPSRRLGSARHHQSYRSERECDGTPIYCTICYFIEFNINKCDHNAAFMASTQFPTGNMRERAERVSAKRLSRLRRMRMIMVGLYHVFGVLFLEFRPVLGMKKIHSFQFLWLNLRARFRMSTKPLSITWFFFALIKTC